MHPSRTMLHNTDPHAVARTINYGPDHATQQLLDISERTTDIDVAAAAHTKAHAPTPGIRAFLTGRRDWRCRWPGGGTPASTGKNGHRVNPAEGGSTPAANMVMLCRRHHNRKMAGANLHPPRAPAPARGGRKRRQRGEISAPCAGNRPCRRPPGQLSRRTHRHGQRLAPECAPAHRGQPSARRNGHARGW